MKGAIIIACCRRYKRKESPDQRPNDLTTSKGTPLRRYSRVAPMRMPWPLRDSIPSSDAARLMRLRNSVVDGEMIVEGCLRVVDPHL